MASTNFQTADEPSWSFVNVPSSNEDEDADEGLRHRVPGNFAEDHDNPSTDQSGATNSNATDSRPQAPQDARPHRPNKTYSPRTCRICLEVVQPTFHQPSASLPRMFQSTGYVTYESEDPASGRLIRPCKCRGSSRFVHEACLQQWRYSDPSFGSRNYWTCPTCGFRYRLQRMNWGRAINSLVAQIVLTVLIFVVAIFVLGFVADPIINMYVDPYDTIVTGRRGVMDPVIEDEELSGWFEHFMKGLASLGLLGFVKVIFVSPWQWWNLRQSGLIGSGRGGTTGRDRAASISWIVIVMGVATFLWAVWKGVRAWSRRTLEMASEKVMDVPLEGDDEEEEDEPVPTT